MTPALPLHLLDSLPPDAKVSIGLPIDTAAHGAELIVGAYLAIRRNLAAGGMAVRPVWCDDSRSAVGGQVAARKLVHEGIRYVVGHFSSRAALAAAPIYAAHDVLLIAPGASAPQLTTLSNARCVLRLFGRDDEQAAAIFNALLQGGAQDHIELFAEDTEYGRGVSDSLLSMLVNAGLQAHASIVREQDAISFDSAGPAVLTGSHEFSARVLQRISPARLRIATDDAFTPAFLKSVGAAAEGVLVPTIGIGVPSEEVSQLNADFDSLVGTSPGAYFLTSYVATNLILTALQTLGDRGGRHIGEYLASHEWHTLLGTLSFEASGEVRGLPWRIARVERGRFVSMRESERLL